MSTDYTKLSIYSHTNKIFDYVMVDVIRYLEIIQPPIPKKRKTKKDGVSVSIYCFNEDDTLFVVLLNHSISGVAKLITCVS